MRRSFAVKRDIGNPFAITTEAEKARGSGASMSLAPKGPNDRMFFEPKPVAVRQKTADGAGAVDAAGNEIVVYEMPMWYQVASIAGTGVGAYHGYKRNDSIGWALWWGFWGSFAPLITIPIALVQGFPNSKKAK